MIMVGEIEIGAGIAKGGMAMVHSGQKAGKPVAVKILHKEFALDQEMVQLLDREAGIVSLLGSPFTAKFEGRGEYQECPYFAMELIPGSDLSKYTEAGSRLTENGIINIFRNTALALGAVHAKGVVHCDIKAANIMLEPGGRVRLVDFGIARMAGDEHPFKFIAATCENMSPEQGLGGRLDARSDIYSLGTVIYELASGKPLFKESGSFTDMVARHVHVQPPPLGFLPPAVGGILERCLAKSASERFQNTAELLMALDRAQKTVDPEEGWWRPAPKAA